MKNPTISPEALQLCNLLKEYSFDVEAHMTEAVIEAWLQEFDLIWISHAITEALYQGRYKLVSVEQILRLWQRRGHPIRHFNREFETIILGQSLLCYPQATQSTEPKALLPKTLATEQSADAEILQSPSQPQPSSSPSALPSEFDHSLAMVTEDSSPLPVSEDLRQTSDTLPQHDQSLQPGNLTSWFHSQMPVPEFREVDSAPSGTLYHSEPIPPFVPKQEVSTMHQRLRAVVRAGTPQ
jgi:hypothetical protein